MTPQTELVLKQIVKSDETIDPNNAIRAFALLRSTSRFSTEPPYILRFPKVRKMLGVSSSGLYKYFDKGLLKRIYGEGKHAIGVAQDSYIAFTNRRPERMATK